MSSAPTLGCQIAPSYQVEEWLHSSDPSDYDESRADSIVMEELPEEMAEIDTARIQRDLDTVAPATRVSTRRRGRVNVPAEPVGFWHWSMAGVRMHVLKLWLRTNLILAVTILALLCLFWGALFRQHENIGKLKVWVVDFDGEPPYADTIPIVGPFVTNAINQLIESGDAPGYDFHIPPDFSHDPLSVRKSVFDFNAWAAIVINANASAMLRAAVRDGNSSYDPLGACQIIYNSARDQTTSSTYIVPSMNVLQKRVVSDFGRVWIAHLLANNVSANDMHMETSPQAISPGIEFSIYDLRPFGPPIATPAVSIGLIYLIIISFFSFTFFLPIHLKYLSPKGHPPLKFVQLVIWRYLATVTSYFLLSLVYSFVSLAFLMPMDRAPGSHVWPTQNPNAYGRGTFMVYWMGNWVGMTAFGLASENAAMMLGTPWTALWLIFWVISNVATGFYSLELAPAFYLWGYAWPMHHIVELTRSVLFDLHPNVGQNFGVLIVWCVIDSILFPMCCLYMRWNSARVKDIAAEKEEEWKKMMDKERDDPCLLSRMTTVGSYRDGGWPRRGV